MDFIPDQCLFDHVEIIANGSPDKVTSTIGHGPRSTSSLERFPSLKRLLIREREGNLAGMILRNGWTEYCWSEESRLRQQSWDVEWKLVEKVFRERGIEFVTSQEFQRQRELREHS